MIKNPLTEANGGIRPYHYLTNVTEYGVGLFRIAEAIHCILGSLNRSFIYHSYENAHIKEEMGIIKWTQKEYSKDLYLRERYFQHKYAEMDIASIKRLYPRLKTLALKQKQNLIKCKKEIPKKLFNIALSCYDLLIILAEEGLKAVKGNTTKNALKSKRLYIAIQILDKKTEI